LQRPVPAGQNQRVRLESGTDRCGPFITEEKLVYAIVQARGHQIKVTPGTVVEIAGSAGEQGAEVTFDRVLLVEKDAGDIVAGAPFVADAKVIGVVDGDARGPKLRVFKKKRRKGFRKTRGHRAVFTRVRITDIQV
jgi:large subunit ribosomal protein L21